MGEQRKRGKPENLKRRPSSGSTLGQTTWHLYCVRRLHSAPAPHFTNRLNNRVNTCSLSMRLLVGLVLPHIEGVGADLGGVYEGRVLELSSL